MRLNDQKSMLQETVFQETVFQETVFHVHTFRCKHAENVPDEAYVKRAIEMNAGDIWFTDHAPFPGDPFGLRMAYEEFPEYLDTISALREKYESQIRIHIGLEIEYFEQFADYYRELHENPAIELLMLGQHMAAVGPDRYSFSLPKEELDEKEAEYLVKALVQGMNTGYFRVCAHPDRSFRRKREWSPELEKLSKELIHAAQVNHVTLEHNLSSMRTPHHYWEEFWALVPEGIPTIVGCDAHKVSELRGQDVYQVQPMSNGVIAAVGSAYRMVADRGDARQTSILTAPGRNRIRAL